MTPPSTELFPVLDEKETAQFRYTMVDGARTSTAHGRRRTHGSVSQRARTYSDDRISDRYISVDRPSPHELRRARAEFYSRSPEDRRREAHREMEYHASRRRTPRVKQPSLRAPEVIVREERRRHESERRHHRRKPREEGGGEVYVYRYLDEDQGSKSADRPQHRRRSATAVIPSRDEPERVRVSSASLSRRNTGRKVSYHREEAVVLPRTERRSSSDTAIKTLHTRAAISRYFILPESHAGLQ